MEREVDASVCAPELYDARCEGPAVDLLGSGRVAAGPQDFFHPRLMVLTPRADVARKLVVARNASVASKYPGLHRELNAMMTALRDEWVPLEACASEGTTDRQTDRGQVPGSSVSPPLV